MGTWSAATSPSSDDVLAAAGVIAVDSVKWALIAVDKSSFCLFIISHESFRNEMSAVIDRPYRSEIDLDQFKTMQWVEKSTGGAPLI